MNRENVYFSHDANAMNDPKCMMLITQLGMEGYGIFWGLVELLRQQPNYRMALSLIPSIAARFMVSSQKIETVIRSYDLFRIEDDQFFFSQSLRDRMELVDRIREKNSLGGKKSAERRRMLALASNNEDTSKSLGSDLPSEREDTFNKEKKRQEKEIEKNKEESSKEEIAAQAKPSQSRRFAAPSLQEVENYILEKKYNVDAEAFIAFYESNGWKVGRNPMKDWKAAVRTWESRNKSDKTKDYGGEEKSIYADCLP